MIIGFVLDDSLDKPDGVQQAVLTTGEWLRSQGHDVHYLVGHTDRTDIQNVHSLAKTLRVKFNGNTMGTPLPASSSQLKTFFSQNSFDILHVQMPYSPFFAAKVIKLAPKTTKIIGTFHILPYTKFSSLATKQLSRLLRSSLKRFDAFVSVSGPAAKFGKQGNVLCFHENGA
jgi:phosphatidylinositol alpha-mannosyltransferase